MSACPCRRAAFRAMTYPAGLGRRRGGHAGQVLGDAAAERPPGHAVGEVRMTGPGAPTASQPAGPWVTLVSDLSRPGKPRPATAR